MRKNFSLFDSLETNISTLEEIDNSSKITLGPTGKNGILSKRKEELQILTSGSLVIKSLEFCTASGNVILKLIEEASLKTYSVSGDGSTTTILFACQLLKSSLRFLTNGYNALFLSNGFKKISYFLVEKVRLFSRPLSTTKELIGVLKTSLGKKINPELLNLLYTSISQISRDGLLVVEENLSSKNEIEIVQGVELEKGFASSYFVNDLKNFEIVYENPYILITTTPITSLHQIREIIEYIKENNKPLVIVAEEITKEIISTLVLNNIQKKFKVVVIKYSSIKFLKTGILEDLAILTHSNFFSSEEKKPMERLSIEDLGQAEKVIIQKEKSTFLVTKFSKVIAKRRINELTRELILSETEYEKSIFKRRIARLSGNIAKIKIGLSNKYQIEEERQKIENAISTLKSSLEEGIIPGGGMFYFQLIEELENWSYMNLIGDELFAGQILMEALVRPFTELFLNTNTPRYTIFEKISSLGYPYGYNLITKEIINTFESGVIDSAKSVRAIVWNSITIIATLITSE